MINIKHWVGMEPYFLLWYNGDWGNIFCYHSHIINPCIIDGALTGDDYFPYFKDDIEEFYKENSPDEYGILLIKISNISYDSGQISFPETGQWDFPPHYTYDIELRIDK